MLGTDAIGRIVEAVYELLDRVGFSDAPEEVVVPALKAGATLSGTGRLCFSPKLVQRCLKEKAGQSFVLGHRDIKGQALKSDLAVYTGTGGAAPFVRDQQTGRFRRSTLMDLFDAARLCDRLEHIHFFSRPLVAGDIEHPRALDLNTAFASLAGTDKPVLVSASAPEHVAEIAALAHIASGSRAQFNAAPCLGLNINHVVPPMRFDPESCRVLAAAANAGIPIFANVFGQLGASSPVTLAGSVAQTCAEAVAGLLIAWAIDPETPVICGPRPMITDLRTGAMAGGSGEQALATSLAIQVMRHLGLASSVIAGATDSKVSDAQSGYEKALTIAMAAHAGARFITQAAGMHAGLMAASFDSYVIDNDMLGSILRSMAPIEVTADTLALETIASVVTGDGHFLGEAETYQRMRSDFLYPEIGDRRSVEDWEESGQPDIRATASQRVDDFLAEPPQRRLPRDDIEALVRLHDLPLSQDLLERAT